MSSRIHAEYTKSFAEGLVPMTVSIGRIIDTVVGTEEPCLSLWNQKWLVHGTKEALEVW